jgi:hypothetical protein
VTTSNFVSIDDTTLVTVPGQAAGTVAGILRRTGFPLETGNVPYAIKSNSFSAETRPSPQFDAYLTFRYEFADGLNENVEPWGGLVARSRGAALDSRDHMVSARTPRCFDPIGSTRPDFNLRGATSRWIRSIRTAAARASVRIRAGPTIEILGVASAGRQRFTPQPRLNNRYQLLDTLSLLRGNHQMKAGIDYSYVDHERQALPLHFGGRYLFGPLPAISGLLPVAITGLQALALGVPSAYVQGYGNSSTSFGYGDVSLFAQDDWRASDDLVLKFGLRYQNQFWPKTVHHTPGVPQDYSFPKDNNNLAPRVAVSWNPAGNKRTAVHAALRGLLRQHHHQLSRHSRYRRRLDNGRAYTGRATWRAGRSPCPSSPGTRPRHILPESAAGSFPSWSRQSIPRSTRLRASFLGGRRLAGACACRDLCELCPRRSGSTRSGRSTTTRSWPSLGAGRRPLDVGACPHLGLGAAIQRFRRDVGTDGLTVDGEPDASISAGGLLASYTLSKATDSSTDFQSTFVPQDNGRGRDPSDPTGLPLGFDRRSERGPSLQDQRHRFVVSGCMSLPLASTSRPSPRLNPVVRTTFSPAAISTVMATAARFPARSSAAGARGTCHRASAAMRGRARSGVRRLPCRASICPRRTTSIDAIVEGLQSLQPHQLHRRQQHFSDRSLSADPHPPSGSFSRPVRRGRHSSL